MFLTERVENTKTNISCYVTFTFAENKTVYNVKYGRATQTINDSTAHALCMPDS
jgi:hypothetical protein